MGSQMPHPNTQNLPLLALVFFPTSQTRFGTRGRKEIPSHCRISFGTSSRVGNSFRTKSPSILGEIPLTIPFIAERGRRRPSSSSSAATTPFATGTPLGPSSAKISRESRPHRRTRRADAESTTRHPVKGFDVWASKYWPFITANTLL